MSPDLIVERGHKLLAIDAKLGPAPDERDVGRLNRLRMRG